jgi:hypothetical protein
MALLEGCGSWTADDEIAAAGFGRCEHDHHQSPRLDLGDPDDRQAVVATEKNGPVVKLDPCPGLERFEALHVPRPHRRAAMAGL